MDTEQRVKTLMKLKMQAKNTKENLKLIRGVDSTELLTLHNMSIELEHLTKDLMTDLPNKMDIIVTRNVAIDCEEEKEIKTNLTNTSLKNKNIILFASTPLPNL